MKCKIERKNKSESKRGKKEWIKRRWKGMNEMHQN
jgi:hypothetical protein